MRTATLASSLTIALALVGCSSTPTASGDRPTVDHSLATAPIAGDPIQIKDFDGVDNYYVDGPFALASQPDADALRRLADEGVTLVVNFRTPGEMDDLSFDEAALLDELGVEYAHIPLGGDYRYTPEVVDRFAETLEHHDGKAFVHCRSGGRVTYVWVAYLIRNRGYDINEAIAVGEKLRMRPNPLEGLLGRDLGYRYMDWSPPRRWGAFGRSSRPHW